MKRGCPIEQPRLFFRAVAFLLPYAARKAGNFEKDEGTRNARVQDPEPLQLRFLHLLHLTHSLRETPLQQELSVHAGRDLPLPFCSSRSKSDRLHFNTITPVGFAAGLTV